MLTSGQRKQLAIRKPSVLWNDVAGTPVCISPVGHRHVCSICETETEIQTEEDVPVGNLSHDDSVESITYWGWKME